MSGRGANPDSARNLAHGASDDEEDMGLLEDDVAEDVAPETQQLLDPERTHSNGDDEGQEQAGEHGDDQAEDSDGAEMIAPLRPVSKMNRKELQEHCRQLTAQLTTPAPGRAKAPAAEPPGGAAKGKGRREAAPATAAKKEGAKGREFMDEEMTKQYLAMLEPYGKTVTMNRDDVVKW